MDRGNFTIPINLFSPSREGLDFIDSQLNHKGWFSPDRSLPGTIYANPRGGRKKGFRRDFWVESDELDKFKKDLEDACLPFGLEPHYLQDNIIAITEIKGSS